MTEEEQNALLWVLDQAFEDDPLFAYVQPHATKQRHLKALLHQACLRYVLRFGVVDVADNQAGVALWLPPGRETLTFPRMVQTGFIPFGLALGRALPRMLKVDHILTQMHTTHVPKEHWYLFFLAVDPAFHGKGVGSTLLERGVHRAQEEGKQVYLETQKASNVAFYQHRGFVVQEEKTIAPGLTNWSLTRH